LLGGKSLEKRIGFREVVQGFRNPLEMAEKVPECGAGGGQSAAYEPVIAERKRDSVQVGDTGAAGFGRTNRISGRGANWM
jgi:hypothetical protein